MLIIDRLLTARIAAPNRIIADVGVQVDLILIANGVGLEEPAERRRVDTGLVMIHPQLGDPSLARVLKPPEIARIRDAIFVICVGGDEVTRGVGDRDHGTVLVAVEIARRRRCRAFIPDLRIVIAVTVDVPA